MTQNILAPIDGSDLSESIFPWLRTLAASSPDTKVELFKAYYPPAPVHLLPELTLPPVGTLTDASIKAQTLDYLARRKASLADLQVSISTACGEPADMIVKHAEQADLVVMASHGRGGLGRWFLGSVASKVAKASPVPVLIVGGKSLTSQQEPPQLKTIMVPLDGSKTSEQALPAAVELARQHQAELLLYRSLLLTDAQLGSFVMVGARELELKAAREYLGAIESRLEDVTVRSVVRELPPTRGIVDTIRIEGVDLIAMSSHGHSGLTAWLLGSVTEAVLQRATCPVMVIRPSADEGNR